MVSNIHGTISQQPIRIGLIAGEASGDLLGSGLMKALRQRYPNVVFEGIGGPRMIENGLHSLFPMERLSIMGLVEVLGRLPELFRIRKEILQHFQENPPDVFIGIDAPDFTLGIELRLKRLGVKTAHYVSPSVWAWRQGRIFKIAKAVDLMLTLLPFEARFYEAHKVPVQFVGHPMADSMPLEPDRIQSRKKLGLSLDGISLAVLPGSRSAEVKLLGPVFIDTMVKLHRQDKKIEFVIPAANGPRKQQILSLLNEKLTANWPTKFPVTVLDGHAREAMIAADSILIASGTATLEAMLAKRPMVVAYKLAPMTYWIMRFLLKTKYISLPNLLANCSLVPELIQHKASVGNLTTAVLDQLLPERQAQLQQKFTEIHKILRQNADQVAADAIMRLLENLDPEGAS